MDPVTKDGYELVFEDRFTGHELDGTHWLSYHLPHWSSREQAAARYAVGDGELRLRIEAEQPPWCPELDGDTRVSSLQTAVFAGPVGSTVGQHRFHPPPSCARPSRCNASTPPCTGSSSCAHGRPRTRGRWSPSG